MIARVGRSRCLDSDVRYERGEQQGTGASCVEGVPLEVLGGGEGRTAHGLWEAGQESCCLRSARDEGTARGVSSAGPQAALSVSSAGCPSALFLCGFLGAARPSALPRHVHACLGALSPPSCQAAAGRHFPSLVSRDASRPLGQGPARRRSSTKDLGEFVVRATG